MTKPKNIEAAKTLIERYREITIEEIKSEVADFGDFYYVRKTLTGFGDLRTCKLCEVVKVYCLDCIYGDIHCNRGENSPTYSAIAGAETPEQLKTAYEKRADRIEYILKENGYHFL